MVELIWGVSIQALAKELIYCHGMGIDDIHMCNNPLGIKPQEDTSRHGKKAAYVNTIHSVASPLSTET